jgi:hypothetical protein
VDSATAAASATNTNTNTMNSDLTKAIVAGLVRWLVAGLAGYLVKHGYDLPNGFNTEATGVILGAAAAAWSVWHKVTVHAALPPAPKSQS